jgi:ATP-dependent Clp protease protease subunit
MSEHILFLTAPISQSSAGIFVPYLIDLQLIGATRLTIAISSPGGNVVAGITMYNALMSMPFEIITHNFGNVDSIATAVFLGGSTRYANATSTFMFHGVAFDGNVNERLEEKNLLEKLDVIRAEHKRIAALISNRTSLSVKSCVNLFKQQRTKGATWAMTHGIVNDITDFVVPAGANVKHLV